MLWGVRLVNREWWYSVVNFIWKVSKTHYGDTVDKAIILSCRVRGSCEELPSCCRQGPRSFYPGALPSELQGLLHPIGTRRRRISGEGIVVVQSLSCVRLFLTPWTAARQTSLSFTISWSLLKFMSIESVMPSNHLILCRSLLLLLSILPCIKSFSNELALWIRWPKYWSFSTGRTQHQSFQCMPDS